MTKRTILAGVMLSFLMLPLWAGAQDEEKKKRRPSGFSRFGQVISPEMAEKLNLNSEQKSKIEKIQKAYQESQREVREKMQEIFKKARENKDRDAVRKAFAELREKFDFRKSREELESKINAVLNDDQKKKFEELRRNRRSGGFGFGRPSSSGISPFTLQRLGLTDEQKEKVAKLQKEMDEKIRNLLTDEQKEKLEQIRKGRTPRRRRPDSD